MVSGIGTTSLYSSNTPVSSSAGLEAQLEKYRIKLADWKNCPSCKTPEGKAKIAEITSKIDVIKSQIAAADAQKQNQTAGAFGAKASSNRNAEVRNSYSASIGPRSDTLSNYPASEASVGNLLSIHA